MMLNIYKVRRVTTLFIILIFGYVLGVGSFNKVSTAILVPLLVFYIMAEDLKDL